jgi:CheY-like chemotaxis protein
VGSDQTITPKMQWKKLYCLIVDDEAEIGDLISMMIDESYGIRCDVASSGLQAIQLLKEHPTKYAFIISDYKMPNGNGGDIWQYLQANKISIPFILCSSESPSKFEVFSGANLQGFAEKPFFQKPLFKAIDSTLEKMDLPADPVLPIDENQDSPATYQKVHVRLLRKIRVLASDVFLQLNSEKFIRLFRKGDSFSDLEVERFQKKHVQYLYLEVKELNRFYAAVLKEMDLQSRSPGEPQNSENQLLIAGELQETIHDLCVKIGFTIELEALAMKNVKSTMALIAQNPNLAEIAKKISINDSYISAHSLLLCFVNCWIAKCMEWHSEQTLAKLTFASILHDITLNNDLLAMVRDEKELLEKSGLFSNDQVIDWRSHANEAAQITSLFAEIPVGVDAIINQHHDPIDRDSTYQLKRTKGLDSLTPLSSLFMVAHDFVDYVLQEKNGVFALSDYIKERKTKYDVGLFKRIMHAIEVNAGKG